MVSTVVRTKPGQGSGRKEIKAMGAAQLQGAPFAELVQHFNWATDRRNPDVVPLNSTRRYLFLSTRPADPAYQEAVAAEMVRRIKSRRVPGEYSRLLTLELLTSLNPDSPVSLQLAANLASRMRTFSEAHHALDYCTGYWHHEPQLVKVLTDRLQALANTEEERALAEKLAA